MTQWIASNLGWNSGSNVSNSFASLFDEFKPGDTLVLDGMYRIEGSKFQLPDDFTLTATNGGGFEVVDAATNRDPLLYLGNRTIIDNVTVKVSGVPDTGYSGASAKRGVDYADKVVFASYGKHDVTITSSAFEGDVTMFFDFRGGNRLTIEDSRFDGAMYQMRLLGDINDVRVEGSVFRDAIGDGIKTERFDGQGVDGMVVLDSAFVGNNRDGIDTAGGLQNALISRTVFRDNGVSGIDIKAMIERPDDLSTGQLNTNIRIENSEFIDSRNAIVVTMLDRAGLLTKANADTYMPHDIRVVDTIFEKTAHHNEEMRAFLVKDGYNITWTDIRMLGSIDDEVRIMNAEAPQGWSAHNVKGTNVSYGPARAGDGSPLPEAGPGASGDSDGSTDPKAPVDEEQPGVIELTPRQMPILKSDSDLAPKPAPSASEPEMPTSNAIFLRPGNMEFDGSNNSVIEVRPGDALKTKAAELGFTFNANDTTGIQGLISKDASGHLINNGHFTSYLDGDTLHIRFQEGSGEHSFSMAGVRSDRDYAVTATFGNGKISASVDDQQIGAASFAYDWTDNEEYLQIGANGWASTSGSAGFRDVFDGTLSDVTISELGTAKAKVTNPIAGDDPDTRPAPVAKLVPDLEPASPSQSRDDGSPALEDASGNSVFSHMQNTRFTVSGADVIEQASTDAMNIEAGAISFMFNTDKIGGMQGLVSKDGKGTVDNDGHFTSYLQGNTLEIRFQQDEREGSMSFDGIKAGQDYDVTATFGDGVVAAWVNGSLIGRAALDYDWMGNDEYLQIGANGWASESGKAGFRDGFVGTISDVLIEERDLAFPSTDEMAASIRHDGDQSAQLVPDAFFDEFLF